MIGSAFLSFCVKSSELTAKAQKSTRPTCVRDGWLATLLCLPAAGPASASVLASVLLRGSD